MSDTTRSEGDFELPGRMPILALRDLVFFPSMVLPLLVGRPRSEAALVEAQQDAGLLLLLAQRDPQLEDPTTGDLHRVGTVVRLVQSTELPDGTRRVVFEGITRAAVRRFIPGKENFRAEIAPLDYPDAATEPTAHAEALFRRVERMTREYVHLHRELPEDLAARLAEIGNRVRLGHLIAGHLIVPAPEKQAFLEAESLEALFTLLGDTLTREIEILQIEDQFDRDMRSHIDEERRQGYLNEQLRVIRKELRDVDGEWSDLEQRLANARLPPPAQERAEREFERLQRMNAASPEAGVIRGYLDWILTLPWDERSVDNVDVGHARSVLEEAHFGLDEVKDRILDHIAVLSLVGGLQGPVLCLVGPPGVGKTSLGMSIARSLDRRFVRVALGGVRDEAEIRGHRRTYVGALPGRVLQGMKKAATRNPVFLLDEIDKVARDGHGDPSAALLEVLDAEQNRTFQDHYLELEFDLSEVLFVATANTLAGIPDALRDRMEVIRIPGYLDTEKRTIAEQYLVPAQLRRHGLDPDQFGVSSEAVSRIIEDYTREAGVRELDRSLARVSRKLAREAAEAGTSGKTRAPVQPSELKALLGPPPHRRTEREAESDRVGMAIGLAWTPVGGEVLEVEVVVVPGTGEMRLTGTLGDVMKESAMAAFTFARSRSRLLGLRPHFHQEVDLHIHIPEGATPKDGPSAGITIAAALISALTGVSTRHDVAMTGEITLGGRILPVGGIKEKAVAALRNGMRTVLIPAGNAMELELLPTEVLERVAFRTVERMDEVLDLILVAAPDAGINEPRNPGSHSGVSTDSGLHLSQ